MLILTLPGDLRSLGGVVKRLRNWLKIGLQAGFGPNFTVEFEAEFQKKFGLAYCTLHLGKENAGSPFSLTVLGKAHHVVLVAV